MNIVYAIPTINPDRCGETFAKWRAMGYRTAALVSGDIASPANADVVLRQSLWMGWPRAVNTLCAAFPDADWLITGGDDITADPNRRAEEIAFACNLHFAGTFGVMQPSGDAYGALRDKSAAVSPWLGREFRERVNAGNGPLWPSYYHWWADTELKEVAERLGCLWWRDDLNQYHDHYLRRLEPTPDYFADKGEKCAADREHFKTRLAAGFPGHQPLVLERA